MRNKQIIAFLTAAILSATGILNGFPITAAGTQLPAEESLTAEAAVASADNSFGIMLANKLNKPQLRPENGCKVIGIEMSGTEAVVRLEAAEDCRIVVCVYDDPCSDGAPVMLGSGVQWVTAGQETVTVPVEINKLPDYYLVRVFLIGEDDIPLSEEYSDPMHTRKMRSLMQSTVNDYSGYEVLNLDGSDTTNFAVYKKEVTVLKGTDTENTVTEQDTDEGICRIRNYTGPTEKGSIVSIEAEGEYAVIFRIRSSETKDGITTVQTEPDLETDDTFEFVKYESDPDKMEADYSLPSEDEVPEGVTVSGAVNTPKPAQGLPDAEAAGEIEEIRPFTKSFRVALGKEADEERETVVKGTNVGDGGTNTSAVGVNGVFEMDFGFSASYYKTGSMDFTSLNISLGVSVGVEFTATFSRKLPLGVGICFESAAGVEFHVGPYLYGEITGTLAINFSAEMQFDLNNGWNVSKKNVDAEFRAEARLGIGLGLGGGINILNHKNVSVNADVNIGVIAEVTTTEPHKGCSLCLDGTCSFEIVFSGNIGPFSAEKAFSWELFKFFVSDAIGFGIGECPNRSPGSDPDDPGEEGQEEQEEQETHVPKTGLTREEQKVFTYVAYWDGTQEALCLAQRGDAAEEDLNAITEFTLPDYDNNLPVTGIYSLCFRNMKNLRTVNLHDNVRYIGSLAFAHCEQLEELRLPPLIEKIEKGAFRNTGIRKIKLPWRIKEIPEDAFYQCRNLASIEMPQCITRIGKNAFADCLSLTDLEIPSEVTEIKAGTFDGCSALIISIPATVERIEERAFAYVKEVHTEGDPDNTLVLSPNIAYIGKYAFYKTNVQKLVMPDLCKFTFEKAAFSNMEQLKEVKLSQNIQRLPSSTFSDCKLLETIRWPRMLRQIDSGCFRQCVSLKKADFPATVEYLGWGAFASCFSLEQDQIFTLPGGIKKLDRFVFNCSPAELHIPASVEQMYFDSVMDIIRPIWFMNPDVEFLDDPETFQKLYDSDDYRQYLTVVGWKGSTAQAFAENPDHPYQFTELSSSLLNKDPYAGENGTPKTMTFTDLEPNAVYNFYDRTGDAATPQTLLYLSQVQSDENGCLTVRYRTRSADTKAEKYVRLFRKDILSDDPETETTTDTTVIPDELFGDLDENGDISIADAILLARYLAEDSEINLTAKGKLNADCNHDGMLTAEDTMILLQFLAGIIPGI